ncbi:MAG: hypothetical protein QXR45_07475 [Candidatus Bathyarchaeia archaeon]
MKIEGVVVRRTFVCPLRLEDVVAAVVSFFEQRGIAVKTVLKETMAFCKAFPHGGLMDPIEVSLEVKDDNLTLSFESSRKFSRLLLFLGKTFSIFGAGYFALLGLKSEEELERMENEFWDFIKRLILSSS